MGRLCYAAVILAALVGLCGSFPPVLVSWVHEQKKAPGIAPEALYYFEIFSSSDMTASGNNRIAMIHIFSPPTT